MPRQPPRAAAARAGSLGARFVLALFALALPRVARAQQEAHAPVSLDVDACAGVDTPEVRRLVPIELAAPLVESGLGDAREVTRAAVGCVANEPDHVHLEVRDPTTGKSLDRVITLAGVPKADQARLVAIAVVELVAASWGELRHETESVPHAVGATASSATRDLALTSAQSREREPAQPKWRVFAVGSMRHFGALPHLVPGGGVSAQRTTRWGFAVGADALVEGGAQPTSLGEVDTLLLSGSLLALVRGGLGPLTLESGAGARLGWAQLVGRNTAVPTTPVRTGTVSGAWVGPAIVLRGLLTPSRHFVIAVGGELGDATAGALGHVEGGPDVGVRGVWWSANLGAGFAF
ncbi:MAG TPA: hypothetical protein VHJ20_13690 [Polyangia bacterium]|nr:hypothetical protein [Polyangia bacterium]